MNKWISPRIREEIMAVEKKQDEKIQSEKLKKPINYVLLDAALWDVNMDAAFDSCPVYTSLFAARGAEHKLDDVAPYLFPYFENTNFSKWLKLKEEQGLRALYISSDETMERLRKHLRRFLRIKTEDGKWLFFRFYDPFVVNDVFPHLTPEQSASFFEKIDYMIADDIKIAKKCIYYLSLRKELEIKYQNLSYVDNNR